MICPACRKDVNPVFEMNSDMSTSRRCPDGTCNAMFPADQVPVIPVSSLDLDQLKPARKIPAGQDVVSSLRARLQEITLQLKDHKQLQDEAKMLSKMIVAADKHRSKRK